MRRFNVFLLTFVLVTAAFPAQKHTSSKELPPSAYKLVSVEVSGTQRYKPEDVIRASGLKLGQTVHKDDLEDATRRLGDSSAFTDVAYTFEYSPEGTKVELQVKDAQRFVPARFENFVWFSHQELMEKIRAQVPLFDGQLPVTGHMPDDVSEALQAMIDEKKLAAEVDYSRLAPDDGPTEAFVYSVRGPRIVIRDVQFSGVNADEYPALAAAGKSLLGTEYSHSEVLQAEDKSLLSAFSQRGYLKATFGPPESKVLAPDSDSDPNEVPVAVTFPVEPGPQYKLAGIEIDGDQHISEADLRKLIHLRSGQPADEVQLADDVQAIKNFYGSHGYMDAAFRTEPARMDDAQHTVMFRIVIQEGDIYKMGDLEILGVDSRTKDSLQNNWTLLTGDVYNAAYTRRFVSQALQDVLKGQWKSDIQETPDRKDKTVDVTLRFIAQY